MTKVIIAVDPGKASGLAVFSYEPGSEPELIMSGEYLQHEYARPIREAIGAAIMGGSEIIIACERFTINAQTVKNSQAPFSLEQIGILKQIIMDIGMSPDDIYFQSPADAKAMFDNAKLKKLEYWHKGGEGHALDAVRHGLLKLVRLGWVPKKLLS